VEMVSAGISMWRSRLWDVLSAAGYVIKWGVICHVALEYVAGIVICEGESMEPTLSTGDIILTDQITPRLGQLNRGDIVVARSPRKPREHICKRVIALSGDSIAINRLDGTLASMPIVPRGHIWVEGDNSSNSADSRDYGPIPVGLVKGRVMFKIWPPKINMYPSSCSDPPKG